MSKIILHDGSIVRKHTSKLLIAGITRLITSYPDALLELTLSMIESGLFSRYDSPKFGKLLLNQVWDKQPDKFELMISEMQKLGIIVDFAQVKVAGKPCVEEIDGEKFSRYRYKIDSKYLELMRNMLCFDDRGHLFLRDPSKNLSFINLIADTVYVDLLSPNTSNPYTSFCR